MTEKSLVIPEEIIDQLRLTHRELREDEILSVLNFLKKEGQKFREFVRGFKQGMTDEELQELIEKFFAVKIEKKFLGVALELYRLLPASKQ